MIEFESTGSTDKTEQWLTRLSKNRDISSILNRYGREGVQALASATPVDSGATASSWSYEVIHMGGSWQIIWKNSAKIGTAPLAILLQYGHGTGTGGWVRGRDYINPAIKPIFDKIADEVWKAVKSA